MGNATAVRERPIIMRPESVRAILDGRKTVTRRAVKITHRTPGLAAALLPPAGMSPRPRVAAELCPYGAPGDRLWVRETFARRDDMRLVAYQADGLCGAWIGDGDGGSYFLRHGRVDDRANGSPGNEWRSLSKYGGRWRSPRFMPRWASRITLEVVSVRVERLQEIGHDDALAEGLDLSDTRVSWEVREQSARVPFARLWDNLNGRRPGCAWAANPWVWVIEFRPVPSQDSGAVPPGEGES